MRIALVAPLVTSIAQPFIGGSQALVAELAQGLQQRGHAVTLFARTGSSVPGITIEQLAVPDQVRPAIFSDPGAEQPANSGFFAQANIFLDLFLNLQQRQTEFDLIHAHAFDWPAFVTSALVRPIPVIHTIHLPAVSPEINEALRVLHQRNHPLKLITVSHSCAQTYASYTPFDRVIYNGLKIEQIPFAEHVSESAPLLFAGRITPEKGVEEAIEIAEQAGVPLLIAGGIYDQHYYEQRILPRIHQAGDHVRYLGQLDHETLWQLMGEVRGLLFPIAWDEPFGLTPVEAMAAGTPVIAFQRGAAAEVIRDGETGFLIQPGNCRQAAEHVPALSHLSRKACRSHVERSFSFAQMLDEYEEVYAELL
ncbi:glycosyltransferase family 4 protein [Tengunoibacter tsumagoiensis]|uniref:Glycosyl transferase n=1 Tax=Tengunoibacter tsumagoiensis TaxID=2014871 RepID=A0A401ZTR4_9CHLR|nr:glycosyltransferase family 4 protein [Tengunoibacter tsumagoiensis]GCE10289.1 glycosyl transferase [Tengunoibacter tsumagoiensis]